MDVFRCSLCGKKWERGGHKEGFVKSAARTHVGGCRDIVLWNAGWVGTECISDLKRIEDVQGEEWLPRWRRNTLALIRNRKKEGLTPTYG